MTSSSGFSKKENRKAIDFSRYLWGRNILAMPDESVPILYLAEPEHIRAPFKVPFAGSGHIAQIACGHEFNVVLTGMTPSHHLTYSLHENTKSYNV